ncbi:hypothetical protein SINU_04460 [Sporolactobacillus inulinus CASD]|uniref:Flagellar biosynthesis protein FlhF n=2 Tax=Sporolactobacillus inulinus TaxID=2078 RepID=A0A0U1QQU4_9BACL|nr:hypothetical protein SINU_04460 [Sporolactobacillus inulinus CASD]GEB75915.1 flagellar biosynthesis protein FlhF [Sporolactobacillus inulinus]
MKMKKIIAPTMAQAIEKVKQELGDDAVIFHTKKVTDGKLFNLFKKEHVEVFVASDSDTEASFNKRSYKTEVKTKESKSLNQGAVLKPMPYKRLDEKVDRLFSVPQWLKSIQDLLLNQGVQWPHAEQLLQGLVKKWYQSDERMSGDEAKQVLYDELLQRLNAEQIHTAHLNGKYMMLVGPTGVGKTTTLAKLASRAVLEEGKKVAFITADTYRIAAVDQLKMYADILEAPMETAYTEQDFNELLQRFSKYDHVFIDTAGRNFQNSGYIAELLQFLKAEQQINMYLVLAATAKFEDLNRVINQFESLHVSQLIVTKVDETATYGTLISILLQHPRLNIAYMTNGQEVPDDLQKAHVGNLINHLLGGSDGQ